MAKVLSVDTYNPKANELFLLDANIWMYLLVPMGDYNKQMSAQYSRFFQKAQKSHSRILVSSLILSEFFNACLKIELELYGKQFSFETKSKRDFRKTQRYKQLIPDIEKDLRKILQNSERIDDRFTAIDIGRLTTDLERCGFNDKYYAELANLCNFSIVTDDADFAIREMPTRILTANRRMLQSN